MVLVPNNNNVNHVGGARNLLTSLGVDLKDGLLLADVLQCSL